MFYLKARHVSSTTVRETFEREPQDVLQGLGNGLARVFGSPRLAALGGAAPLCLRVSLIQALPRSLLYLRDCFHCTVEAAPKASCSWPLRSTKGYLIIAAVWVCQMIQKAHQTKCFSIDVAARRKDKSLFLHFKTLVDCEYRSVSGRAVNFFFLFSFAYCACAGTGRAKSGVNPPRVPVCVRGRTLKGPPIPLNISSLSLIDRDTSTTC